MQAGNGIGDEATSGRRCPPTSYLKLGKVGTVISQALHVDMALDCPGKDRRSQPGKGLLLLFPPQIPTSAVLGSMTSQPCLR